MVTDTTRLGAPGGRRYKIVGTLGAGGMGTVYDAIDMRLRRPVALKFARRHVGASKQLAWEAAVMALPRDARVCEVYDLAKCGGRTCLVLERLVGESLAARLLRCPVSTSELLAIAAHVAGALDAVHRVGLVHQDIKPSNIFLTLDGSVKVLDFGLTTIAGDSSDGPGWRRAPGRITCSPNYVAPERLCGSRADFRSDLYSLGVVLYEMATGWPPFSADSLEEVLSNVLAGHHPRAVQSMAPERPAALDRVIRTLLAPKAGDRYQSATEVARALRAVRNRCH